LDIIKAESSNIDTAWQKVLGGEICSIE